MRYWIIEHPTRGCLVSWELDVGASEVVRPQFSWTVLRTDQKIHAFWSVEAMRKKAGQFPAGIRSKCYGLEIANGRIQREQVPLG